MCNEKYCRKKKKLTHNRKVHVRFEVLVAVSMKITAFLDVRLCDVVDHYQHFGGTCCLHFQVQRIG
jgi:hypothetical protein